MIPKAKERALIEALERDGEVTFKNGSKVEWSAVQAGERGERRLVVTRPDGGVSRFTEDEVHRAYEMALDGPVPKEQPSRDPSMFGSDPPF